MKGRVVACVEYGKPFEIQEYDVPEPAPGAVLLRMTQAGICGSDLHVWRGDQVNVPLPPTGRAMGHEGTGVVEILGDGVDHRLRRHSRSRRATGWSMPRCSPATPATSASRATPTGA